MSNLINGRTPEEIKRVLAWRIFRCGDIDCGDCPYGDICSHENEERSEPDALALIETLEAEIADLKLAHDCSTCGEEYCDVHFYPCCACHNTAPVSMSKWHPKGTKAPPREENV